MFWCRMDAAQASWSCVAKCVRMSNPAIIPPAIRRYLRRHILRRRAIALLRSVAMACIAASVWMLAWALVDRLLPLPAAIRVSLLTIVVVAIVWILFRPIRRALLPRFDWI